MSIRTAPSLLVVAATVAACLAGCKPSGQKITLGPFSIERFDATTSDGTRVDCFVFGAESNRPSRLCGNGSPTPGFAGVMFNAVAIAPGSKFEEVFGAPQPAGFYLLKPAGQSAVDAWSLGAMGMREWLGGGKILLGVDKGADNRTHVRLLDPATRGDKNLDAGPMRGDSWLLVRAPADESILLLQRLGGEEMIVVRDPLGNAELSVGNASEDKTPGNRKLYKRGELERMNGGTFKPNVVVTTAFKWEGDKWTFEGAPLGPFTAPAAK